MDSNTSAEIERVSNNSNMIYVIIALVVTVILSMCCAGSCALSYMYFQDYAKQELENISNQMEKPVEKSGDEEINIDNLIDLDNGIDSIYWEFQLDDINREAKTLTLDITIKNISESDKFFSSWLSVKLKNKNSTYGEFETGYSRDVLSELEEDSLDVSVASDSTKQGKISYIVPEDTELSDLYVEFKPNFFSDKTEKIDLE